MLFVLFVYNLCWQIKCISIFACKYIRSEGTRMTDRHPRWSLKREIKREFGRGDARGAKFINSEIFIEVSKSRSPIRIWRRKMLRKPCKERSFYAWLLLLLVWRVRSQKLFHSSEKRCGNHNSTSCSWKQWNEDSLLRCLIYIFLLISALSADNDLNSDWEFYLRLIFAFHETRKSNIIGPILLFRPRK